jgi:hypothetical protein
VESSNEAALTLYKKQLFYPIRAENGPINDASLMKTIYFADYEMLGRNAVLDGLKNIGKLEPSRLKPSRLLYQKTENAASSTECPTSPITGTGTDLYSRLWARVPDLKLYDRILLRRELDENSDNLLHNI